MTNRLHIRTLREAGMTLVEMLIVIAILGILANIVVPGVMAEIINARAGSIIGEHRLVENAVFRHWADTGQPPRKLSRLMERRGIDA